MVCVYVLLEKSGYNLVLCIIIQTVYFGPQLLHKTILKLCKIFHIHSLEHQRANDSTLNADK